MMEPKKQPTLMTREEWRDADFKERLRHAVNCCSRENGSNTPDFILAEFLFDCLAAFDRATKAKDAWYQPEEEQKDLPTQEKQP